MSTREINKREFVAVGNRFPMYTKTDLCKRWGITNQRLQAWEKRYEDFPPRQIGLLVGDLPIYSHADVIKFEEGKGGKDGIAKYYAARGNR